jgi:cyclopropane fatty-acyl-phospholipid synthase-like methyltransferase
MAEPGFDPSAYGIAIAGVYDEMYEAAYDTAGAIEFITELAGDGPLLEFGIGTGRLAQPLAARGLSVSGIDGSQAMVDGMRHRPGADAIDVKIGNFADVDMGRYDYAVVLLAINTIFALPDQDAQVDAFINAARHLIARGRFIVEAWVPDLSKFHRQQAVWAREHNDEHVSIEIGALDTVNQYMKTTQVRFGAEGVQLFPANHRYAWPAELDLMARLAGMTRVERWQDWRRAPFTSASTTHVSVYERLR